jgi:hypothetical protein
MAICYFDLEQWCELGELILILIAGIVNPSDALTKLDAPLPPLPVPHGLLWLTHSSAASSTALTVGEGVSGPTDGHGIQEPDP